MDEKPGLQQFWHRSLLVMGILWGIIPLVTLPFIIRGTNDSSLDILAAISNGLTIFPASVLAFWHRRIACVWLSINGIFSCYFSRSFYTTYSRISFECDHRSCCIGSACC